MYASLVCIQPDVQCQLAFVEEGTTLVGFDVDDVCDAIEP